MNRILVTGATGLIGNALVERLSEDDRATRCLTRSPERSSTESAEKIDYHPWDGAQLAAESLEDCTAVVHLSGEPVFGGPLTAARKARILDSRVESTRSIVSAIESRPASDRPKTLICASAVGFYGSRGEELLDESAACGTGFLADVCQQWEAAARTAETSGIRVASVRFGIVLARAGGALPMMALPFRFGFGGRTGSGAQWVPWIHIQDAVRLVVRVLDDDQFCGPVNAVAPNPIRNGPLATAIGQSLRRPSWLPVPAFALRVGLGELSDELIGSRRCVPKTALDAGFEFDHTEVETALEAELG